MSEQYLRERAELLSTNIRKHYQYSEPTIIVAAELMTPLLVSRIICVMLSDGVTQAAGVP